MFFFRGSSERKSHDHADCTNEIAESILKPIYGKKLYIAQNLDTDSSKRFRCFCTKSFITYYPLCQDFGPVRFSQIVRFVRHLDEEIEKSQIDKVALCVEPGRRELSNGVFLLGAYLMFRHNFSAERVIETFSWVNETIAEPFRDCTFEESDFPLLPADCWRALARGMACGWVATAGPGGSLWGAINVDEYEHYDDPANADMHIVIPGRFVAFKGPRNLGGRSYYDDRKGFRHFSPEYYADIFKVIGVTAVVRLNNSEYDWRAFTSRGISHFDFEFEDCCTPPSNVAAAFLHLVDSVTSSTVGPSGLVAVHCKAGLGRTGTLIALYMMRSCGFSAREAIAWLRIMRPGSVIGAQQQFLVRAERAIQWPLKLAMVVRQETPEAKPARPGTAGRPLPPLNAPRSSTRQGRTMQRRASLNSLPTLLPLDTLSNTSAAAASSAVQAAQVSEGMQRRGAARLRAAAGASGDRLPPEITA